MGSNVWMSRALRASTPAHEGNIVPTKFSYGHGGKLTRQTRCHSKEDIDHIFNTKFVAFNHLSDQNRGRLNDQVGIVGVHLNRTAYSKDHLHFSYNDTDCTADTLKRT